MTRDRSEEWLRRKYGLSVEEFNDLLESQDGRCAICRTGTPGGRGRWHVDHDHEVEDIGLVWVRGLLCNNCNLMLGFAKDNIEVLNTAIGYLESFRSNRKKELDF